MEEFSYLKYPFIKSIGWKGIVDGQNSGIYKATPLSRLNAADGMATPIAQAAYLKFYETLEGKPVHHTLATHWARLVELMYAAERMKELLTDDRIMSDNFRTIPTGHSHRGSRVMWKPPGETLTHHYKTDPKGRITEANLIVGTTNNYGAMALSIKKAAQRLIKKRKRVKRRHFKHGRNGIPRLRPMPVLRHPHHAGNNGAASENPRFTGECYRRDKEVK